MPVQPPGGQPRYLHVHTMIETRHDSISFTQTCAIPLPMTSYVHAKGIWGRGAVDMKHFAASSLLVVLELARSKTKLRRGIKLVLVADEEAG